eukprot:scaffold894_cov153-Cylindrotheca_fusiformis.AAC.9
MRTTSISRIPTTLTKQKRALSSQLFRSTSSSQTRDDESFPNGFYPVYVHHVSKTALEHLQRKQATWLIKQGLDRGLHINPNGTFSLTFPSRQGFDAGRIWYDDSFGVFDSSLIYVPHTISFLANLDIGRVTILLRSSIYYWFAGKIWPFDSC